MNLTYAYILLAFAIVLEITGTSLVKDTAGFTRWIPSIICLLTICFSYYLMSHVVGYIPIGITYATWSGLGVFCISILSYVIYSQTLQWQSILGLFLIVTGVIIVNTFASNTIN